MLQKEPLVTIMVISNLQVLPLTAHGTVESKTKEGHVTATTQKIGKITDIVRKTTYHRDCQKKTKRLETITKR